MVCDQNGSRTGWSGSDAGDPDQNGFRPDPGQVAPFFEHLFTKNIEFWD